MSDKNGVECKVSLRINKEDLTLMDQLIKKNYFKNRSYFIRKAIQYFKHYLYIMGLSKGERKWIWSNKNKSTEGLLHTKLKDFSFNILDAIGCKQIDFEESFLIEGKRYEVDVSGVTKEGKKTAVECEVTRPIDKTKLDDLIKYFDEVLIITPIDLIEYYEDTLISQKEAIELLTSIKKTNIPLVSYSGKPPKINQIDEDGELIGRQKLPYKTIKDGLTRKTTIVIEGISMNTAESLRKRLELDIGAPITKGRGMVMGEENTESLWILQRKKLPKLTKT